MSRIYVASSWRNQYQPRVVSLLRELGHEVYDFRNPSPDNHGFSWSEIDPRWKEWSPAAYREALHHPVAQDGYRTDMRGLSWCDTCLMVMPAGRSASFELGWAMGAGKHGCLYVPEPCEPELMFSEARILTSELELRAYFRDK